VTTIPIPVPSASERRTRLGISLAADVALAADMARRAEAAGFDRVWSSEFAHRSGIVPLAAMAGATERIGLGSAIVYAFGRAPAVLAGEAADVDRLAGGRLVLGLGTAQPSRMVDWLGVDAAHPAPRMAELVGLLRELWALHRRPVEHDGRFFRLRIAPFGAIEPPLREAIPIYVAGVNRHMVRVAGAVADGLIAHPLVTPAAFQELVRPELEKAGAGRTTLPSTVGMVITCISEDRALARREAAGQLAFYSTNATYDFLLDFHGFLDAAGRIREAVAARDWDAAIRAVPEDMVDVMAVCGTGDEVLQRVGTRLGVYDHLVFHTPSMVATPPPGSGFDPARYHENLDAILDVFGPARV
jgi:alkanesulfonate monooxygenase SsuD/methylene tetrahydromethanopterin reductase-like flavin-dependent oxidoreductase (luciferase family)